MESGKMEEPVRQSEIFKRLLVRYYPVMFLLGLFSFLPAMTVLSGDLAGECFLGLQLITVYIWILIVLSFYLFKPAGLIQRLSVAIGSYIAGIASFHFVFAMIIGGNPLPYRGNIQLDQIFVLTILTGLWPVALYFIEERLMRTEMMHVKEKTKRLSSERRLAEYRLNLLQAQVEPQFLFDTMKSILDYFETAPKKAKKMQVYFIQYLRATLNKTRESKTMLEQEIEMVRAYLEMYRTNMGQRLEYRIDMEPDLYGMHFPSMLLHPVVRCMVKNSIERSESGGAINIGISRTENAVFLRVADDGSGSAKEEGVKAEMAEVQERIRTIYGGRGSLLFEDNHPSGLNVIIKVPYGSSG
jgi:sensor histidine kinase YesM